MQVKQRKPSVYALIGARGGSKSIPKKNLAIVAGYPLIAYSIAAGKLTKTVSRVIVSTDSEDIAAIARKYGAETPFLRPKELAGDRSLDIEFFRHAVKWLQDNEGKAPDLIVHLRPTIPCREVFAIGRAVSEMIADKDATALRSAEEVLSSSIFKSFRIESSYCEFFGKELFGPDEEFFNYPRQELPKTYHVNGYVDIVRTAAFLRSGLLYGKKMRAFINDGPAVDIDELSDLGKAEEELKKPKYEPLFQYLRGV